MSNLEIVEALWRRANSGWYVGTMETLERFAGRADMVAHTTPELMVRLQLTRDRMHHSIGWWRNAEYEYCHHLSLSARERRGWTAAVAAEDAEAFDRLPYEEIPREEVSYWAKLVFGTHAHKLWHEPGGTDPRLTPEEARRHGRIWHLRCFLDPATMQPFIPKGEVYDLTRWIPGLTPPKVDR